MATLKAFETASGQPVRWTPCLQDPTEVTCSAANALRAALLQRYLAQRPQLDAARFMADYAVLAAQRHARTVRHAVRQRGEQGSILSLLCDAGERYLPTYFDTDWVDRTFGDCSAAQQKVDALMG